MPNVDIIIRAKDGDGLTRACVDSILRNTKPESCRCNDYRIILVQSGSNVLDFKSTPPHVSLFSPAPMGAVTATNMGLAVSLQGDAKYVVVMDNDTRVPEGDHGWLDRFVSELEEYGPQTAAVGATSGYVNQPQHILAVPQTYTADWKDKKTGAFGMKENVPSIWFVSFCVMIRKEVIQQLGLWDTRFDPGNWEDTDYSMRVRKAGYQIRVARSVYIHHDGHKTFGANLSSLLTENQHKFIEKWGFGTAWEMGLIPDAAMGQLLRAKQERAA